MEIVNLCIVRSIFPRSEKVAGAKPIVKGTLDSQVLSLYRPVSDLSFLSKITECVFLEEKLRMIVEATGFA